MIDLGSVARLYEHEHELHAYCATCDRWAALELGAMVAQGKGARRLLHCQHCIVVDESRGGGGDVCITDRTPSGPSAGNDRRPRRVTALPLHPRRPDDVDRPRVRRFAGPAPVAQLTKVVFSPASHRTVGEPAQVWKSPATSLTGALIPLTVTGVF